jgi:hypothetical protein
MNRLLRSFMVATVATTGAVAFSSGCADNNSSLFIYSVLYRRPPECVVTADATAESIGHGTLDLAFAKSYVAALLVGNQLTSRGDKQNLHTETSRITLRGAEINLTDSTGHSLFKFSVNGTGFVDVSRGEDSGLGIFDAELIPASIGQQLLNNLNALKAANNSMSQQTSDQVVALVRVFGSTLGNTDVTSSELSFPITYCEGCLIDYPLAAIDFNTMGSKKPTCTKGATDLPVAGCKLGQDDKIDCRSCTSTSTLCENVPANQ